MKLFLSSIVVLLFTASCNHTPKNPRLSSSEWQALSSGKRNSLIRSKSLNRKIYNGLFLIAETEIIHLNSRIQEDNLRKSAQFSDWTLSEAEAKRSQHKSKILENTYFFLQVYMPNKKINKLDKPFSDWNASLRLADGKLITGQIKLFENQAEHNRTFYPQSLEWGRTYRISFPIPTALLDNSSFKVILKGPEGMLTYRF